MSQNLNYDARQSMANVDNGAAKKTTAAKKPAKLQEEEMEIPFATGVDGEPIIYPEWIKWYREEYLRDFQTRMKAKEGKAE